MIITHLITQNNTRYKKNLYFLNKKLYTIYSPILQINNEKKTMADERGEGGNALTSYVTAFRHDAHTYETARDSKCVVSRPVSARRCPAAAATQKHN